MVWEAWNDSSVVLSFPLNSWFHPLSSTFSHLFPPSFSWKVAHVFKRHLSAYICQYKFGGSVTFMHLALSLSYLVQDGTIFLWYKFIKKVLSCVNWTGFTSLDKRYFHRYFWDHIFLILGFYQHSCVMIFLNILESLWFDWYWD